jgi:hypothetical protein
MLRAPAVPPHGAPSIFRLADTPPTVQTSEPKDPRGVAGGNICRAMILAVPARLGPGAPDGMVRLVWLEVLRKVNFNPDEPRDRPRADAHDAADGPGKLFLNCPANYRTITLSREGS